MEILFVAVGAFGVIWTLTFFFLAPKTASPEEVIQQRLHSITVAAGQEAHGVALLNPAGSQRFWEQFATFFLGEDTLTEKYTAMRRLLHLAGYPGERAARGFWGARIFLALVGAVGAYLVTVFSLAPVSNVLVAVIASAGVGYMLPVLQLRRTARLRVRSLREAFPDTLDLFVVCVEAGLGINEALVRVAKEQTEQGLAIGDEFQLLAREMQAGVARREALTRMADRLDLDEFRSLTAFLIQTEELGGSIAHSLRVYADTMREKRIQRAEEAARKMVIKLLFPLVLFILPALFLVIFSPIVINLAKLLASAPGK